MIVEITGRYIGGLGTRMIHGPSGTSIRTAAPLDNHGDGSTFSPTDLAAAAFASCMVTIMAIEAREADIDLEGLTFSVQKHMAADPRRIASLPVLIHMPAGLSAERPPETGDRSQELPHVLVPRRRDGTPGASSTIRTEPVLRSALQQRRRVC